MIIQIPNNQTPNQGKDIINDNFANAEKRLQVMESNVYIRHGNGAPLASLGNDNDYYVDDSNQNFWRKSNGVWDFILNMKGDTGRGFRPRGEWDGNLLNYVVDDIVTFAGAVYRVKFNHTSSTSNTPPNSNLELWADGFRFRGEWQTNTLYKVNDVVTRLGSTYVTVTEHTGGAQPVGNSNFQILAKGFNFRGEWDSAGLYVANEIVTYKGSMYLVVNTKLAADTATPPNDIKYVLLARGLNYRGQWVNTSVYDNNEVVIYEGSTYISTVNGTTGGAVPPNNTNFSLLASGLFHRGAWVAGIQYRKDNTVLYAGSLYRVTVTLTAADTALPPNDARYQLLASKGEQGIQGNKGAQYRGKWNSTVAYVIDDIVEYGGSSWIAVDNNTNITPAENGIWSLLVSKGDPGTINTALSNGVSLPQRSGLNFGDRFKLSDDGVNNETDISLLERIGGREAEVYNGDLNLVRGSGYYIFNRSDAAMLNFPAIVGGEHAWMYMRVIEYNPDWIDVSVTDLKGINTYRRNKVNNVWSGWVRSDNVKALFSVYRSVDTPVAPNTTKQTVWNSSLYNRGGVFDFAANGARIPSDLVGFWVFQTELQWLGSDQTTPNGQTFIHYLERNGVNIDVEFLAMEGTSRNTTSRQIGRVYCNAGDLITMSTRINTLQTSNFTIVGGINSSAFEGHFLGA